MIVRCPHIQKMINNKTSIRIDDKDFYIKENAKGSCDGCYFLGKKCPSAAVTICYSNGGNIFELKEQNNE